MIKFACRFTDVGIEKKAWNDEIRVTGIDNRPNLFDVWKSLKSHGERANREIYIAKDWLASNDGVAVWKMNVCGVCIGFISVMRIPS